MAPRYNWQNTLHLNLLFLRSFGLWPKTQYNLDAYSCYAAIFLTLQFSVFILELVNLYHLRANQDAVIESSVVLAAQLLHSVKISTFLVNYKNLKHILDVLNSELFQPQTDTQRRLIGSKMDLWQVMFKVFVGNVIVLGTLWMALPVLTGSYKRQTLPIPAICPFCEQLPFVFTLVYLYVSFTVLIMSTSAFNVDVFFFALFLSIEVQFELLCDNLKALDAKFSAQILRCIRQHQALVKYTVKVNKVCNFVIFGQFFLSSVIIALLLLQANLMPHGSFLFYSRVSVAFVFMLQIFVYCWFGENINTKSSKLCYAIFQSSWVKESLFVKKILMVFTLNSPAVQISAFNIFHMSLSVFVKLMKSAYSFLMLLGQAANS